MQTFSVQSVRPRLGVLVHPFECNWSVFCYRVAQMTDFYDELAPLYHLIFQDWDASVERQGEQLTAIIRN